MLAAYGDWLRGSLWAYPALEVAHIAAIGMLFGALVVLELRIFGFGADIAVRTLARLALPVALTGFGAAALSGLMMFAADPADLLLNPAFRFKLLLLVLAGLNAVSFHVRSGLDRMDLPARTQAAFSLLVWVGVIVCGRAIAYI